jgi:hypothetical protein
MPLWGLKYMDMDERWWVDLVLQDEAPAVMRVPVGARLFTDGLSAAAGRPLLRRASISAGDLPDWPADAPVALAPAVEATAAAVGVGSAR